MISIDSQIERMKELHPQFEVKFSTSWFVVWEGWLRPFLAKKYKIRITMCRTKFLDDVEIKAYAPRVEILDPEVDGRAPHLYRNEVHPEIPLLCLYDPVKEEWYYDEYVADTTVPWTKRWLASYEGWRATGEWTGGGRDHEPSKDREEPCNTTDAMKKDQQEHFNKSVFNYLGQRIGTYASFPLMVAASKGYFRPLSWHDWKIDSFQENQSATTLITSVAPRLVA